MLRRWLVLWVCMVLAAVQGAEPLRFCVFSDIQPGAPGGWKKPGHPFTYVDQIYDMGLKANMDAFLVCGDIASHSNAEIYDEFRAIWDAKTAHLTEKPAWLVVMGNHDYWEEYWNKKKVLTDDPFGKRPETKAARTEIFRKHLKLDTVNPHVVIKGIDFIGMSLATGMAADKGDIEFLEAALQKAVARDPNKPIIVFGHNNVKNTVYGSNWGTPTLQKTLAKYPQVIYFSGHTHFPLEDERCIHQREFTSVNTSTLSATYLDDPCLEYGERYRGKNAMMVTIDDKQVVIRRYQLRDGSEILDENGKPWTLPLPLKPENFVYEPTRRAASLPAPVAPVFADDAQLQAKVVLNKAGEFTGVRLSGPAASHPRFVHSYSVDVFRRNDAGAWETQPECQRYLKKTNSYGPVKERLKFFSDFYAGLAFMKPNFSVVIPVYPRSTGGSRWQGFDFQPGATYRFEVRARESYGTESVRVLKAEVTMPEKRVANPHPAAADKK